MFEYQSFATLGVNLNRQKYAPLDISQVFCSQADLNYYISKGAITEGVSEYWYKDEGNKIVPYPYPGQVVALVIDKDVSILYLSEQEDGTFATSELGKAPTVDGLTLALADGKICLAGVNDVDENGDPVLDATKRYQPVLISGKLTWQEVSVTTVEGLGTSITALQNEVDIMQADIANLKAKDIEIEEKIGAIEDGKTLIEIIQEVKDSVVYDDTAITGRVTRVEEKVTLLESIGAEKNIIASVNDKEFTLDNQRSLSVKEIEMTKITGLPDALAQKVDAIEGYSLLSPSNREKLNAILLRENNTAEFDGAIKASNVEDLDTWISDRADSLTGLSQNNLTDGLLAVLETVQKNANENVIEIIKVGGVVAQVSTEEKSVDIPIATSLAAGVVKGVELSSNIENSVSVESDGTMKVNSVNINRIIQNEGEVIILDSGNARN